MPPTFGSSFYKDKDLRLEGEEEDEEYRVAEDREYLCLGQWEEDGLMYTYTKRLDVPGYECFVGQADGRGEVTLAEGGADCRRGLRVQHQGMTLTKRSEC